MAERFVRSPTEGAFFRETNGSLLVQLAEDLSLEVTNLRPDCEGMDTWCARSSQSCIDYALVSRKLAMHIARVHVDESGQYSVGSDHNRIKLTFAASAYHRTRRRHRSPARWYLPVATYDEIAEEFEASDIHCNPDGPVTYETFIKELKVIMGRHEVRVNSRKGVQCKPWWDTEVKAALKARRAANREHWSAIRHLSAEDCEQAWYKYLELKRHMQQLVQREIAESDHKKLKELTTPGRSGIQNFWRCISALERKSPSRPTLREQVTGELVSDVKKQITDYIQNVFGTPAPVAAAENVTHITPALGHSQAKDCEWKVSRVALERALA
ncbi:hypothetical protein HPB52_017828 [Rhipicephalus sanguineus]|uniref:Tick transposon n=1 Tax=Rhipicephalus sanguineus TaxID=34632 RepID=A0A9D4QA02_RHISA|nr:hypothetical protein HPB52_017828 [Rhipicephalus sanguineus]